MGAVRRRPKRKRRDQSRGVKLERTDPAGQVRGHAEPAQRAKFWVVAAPARLGRLQGAQVPSPQHRIIAPGNHLDVVNLQASNRFFMPCNDSHLVWACARIPEPHTAVVRPADNEVVIGVVHLDFGFYVGCKGKVHLGKVKIKSAVEAHNKEYTKQRHQPPPDPKQKIAAQ